ncbi:MAG: substrate-binding domain-containing protein [Rhodoferax sp.]|nr:substrate-binding domain-containing protein [Rhodoferax sp.]
MTNPISAISSKATASVLAALVLRYENAHGQSVTLESVGGVDAARRVRDGEGFDVIVLDAAAMSKLVQLGCIAEGSTREFVRSRVVAAVPEGESHPDISTVKSMRQTLLATRSIGFSTGPSGAALQELIQAWGLSSELGPKLKQAPPGVSVGSLIASGAADIGFQQYSELMDVSGVYVLGPLPIGAEIVSTFVAGIGVQSYSVGAAEKLVEFLASEAVASDKQRQGFESV